MDPIFDVFKNYNMVKSHKRARISLDNLDQVKSRYIHISYKGPKESGGFRIKLKTIVGQMYEIVFQAQLLIGDTAFIYCESHSESKAVRIKRLLSREDPKNLIGTKDNLTYLDLSDCRSVRFIAVTEFTHVGILFHNANVKYLLRVEKFQVFSEINGSSSVKRVYSNYNLVEEKEAGVGEETQENDETIYADLPTKTDVINQISHNNHQVLKAMLGFLGQF